MPRKRTPAAQKQDHVIALRVTLDQMKLIVKAARLAGLPTAAFARMVVLKNAGTAIDEAKSS